MGNCVANECKARLTVNLHRVTLLAQTTFDSSDHLLLVIPEVRPSPLKVASGGGGKWIESYILHSTESSWLQKGQLKTFATLATFFATARLLDFLFPIHRSLTAAPVITRSRR